MGISTLLLTIYKAGAEKLWLVSKRRLTKKGKSDANTRKTKILSRASAVNMFCHTAICSKGFIVQIAACPSIKGQFSISLPTSISIPK